MAALVFLLCGGGLCGTDPSLLGGDTTIQFRSGATNLTLSSSDARQQLIVTGRGEKDITRQVEWTSEPAG